MNVRRSAILFVYASAVSLLLWLTVRQNGTGAVFATASGTVFLAAMFSTMGLVAALTIGSERAASIKALNILICAGTIGAIISFVANPGLNVDRFIPHAAIFTVVLLVQSFVISIVLPGMMSKEGNNQFSLRHLIYVTFGFSVLTACFETIPPFSVAIQIGLVLGGVAVGAVLITNHFVTAGLMTCLTSLVFSCLLPAVGILSNGSLSGLLPLAAITFSILACMFLTTRSLNLQ